jgi:hypothetical protein
MVPAAAQKGRETRFGRPEGCVRYIPYVSAQFVVFFSGDAIPVGSVVGGEFDLSRLL